MPVELLHDLHNNFEWEDRQSVARYLNGINLPEDCSVRGKFDEAIFLPSH